MVHILSTHKRDRTGDNFTRASQRMMRRCNQMSRRYGADYYVLVRRKRRYYDDTSTSDPSFPTPIADLVSNIYFSGSKWILTTLKEKTFPPTNRRTPVDFKENNDARGGADEGIHVDDQIVEYQEETIAINKRPWIFKLSKTNPTIYIYSLFWLRFCDGVQI